MARSRFSEEDKENIRRLREEEKLSYTAIGEIYNVAPITINRICNAAVAARQAAETKRNRHKYYQRYNEEQRQAYVPISFYLHRDYDADIIEQIKKQDSQVDYLRKLVLDDMARENRRKKRLENSSNG